MTSDESTSSLSLAHLPVFEYFTQIRERHLDAFGHVNNAQYMILFEESRWEMITSRGYGLKEILERRVGTVVLESTIRYRRELQNREKIKITVQMVEVKKNRFFTLHQSLFKESGELAADARFMVGCFDLESRKLIQPTDDWKKAIFGQNI